MADKNPKQQEKLRNHRRAASAEGARGGKRPTSAPDSSATRDRFLRFRFNRVDIGSDWCLTDIDKSDHEDLIRFMPDMESMKLNEVVPSRCKREDVAGKSPNTDAQMRAQGQFPDDHDNIYVLHMTGTKRLWGLLYDNEFSVIWWDPDHQIWPSSLKNT